MKKVRITAVRKADYKDLQEKYERDIKKLKDKTIIKKLLVNAGFIVLISSSFV